MDINDVYSEIVWLQRPSIAIFKMLGVENGEAWQIENILI